MRQTVAILASILGGALLAGCGGNTTTPTPDGGAPFVITSAFPADGDVTGFNKNTDSAKDGVFKTSTTAEGSIDGDLPPFEAAGFTQLARQHYLGAGLGVGGADYTVDLRIWEMKDAATGASIYASIKDTTRYAAIKNWTDEAMGSAGRYGNSGVMWRVNSYKKAYFVEAQLSDSEVADTTGRDLAVKFVKLTVDKLP
ncbi:MAG TPA: hypothetical protein VGK67_39470 [Myxococcales bacterium]|jgi:hypothetical protein